MPGDTIVALDEEVHDTIACGHASPGWLIDPRTSFDREAAEDHEILAVFQRARVAD